MTSKLPAGHYQNMIDAIRAMVAAREEQARILKAATENNLQRRRDQAAQFKAEQDLKTSSSRHGPSL